MFQFEKYQREILGPSISDSVATLEKKFGKKFFWVCMVFFKKKPAKNGKFSSKHGKFYQHFGHFNEKISFVYLNKN